MDEREIEKEARAIMEESMETGDRGAETGGECVECGDESVWKSPVSGNDIARNTRRSISRNVTTDPTPSR